MALDTRDDIQPWLCGIKTSDVIHGDGLRPHPELVLHLRRRPYLRLHPHLDELEVAGAPPLLVLEHAALVVPSSAPGLGGGGRDGHGRRPAQRRRPAATSLFHPGAQDTLVDGAPVEVVVVNLRILLLLLFVLMVDAARPGRRERWSPEEPPTPRPRPRRDNVEPGRGAGAMAILAWTWRRLVGVGEGVAEEPVLVQQVQRRRLPPVVRRRRAGAAHRRGHG